eukprot:jgi/Chlat1/3448/Chrsp23S03768
MAAAAVVAGCMCCLRSLLITPPVGIKLVTDAAATRRDALLVAAERQQHSSKHRRSVTTAAAAASVATATEALAAVAKEAVKKRKPAARKAKTAVAVPLEDAEDVAQAAGNATSIIGVDPDCKGALAYLRLTDGRVTVVSDVPTAKVAVGKTMRNRHDPVATHKLMSSLTLPKGSVAFIEKSTPYALDGKQGWYVQGFGYGVWLGVLAAHGVRIVPVHPRTWKGAFGLTGEPRELKDMSRALAIALFPELQHMLARKMDHGRAEAMLIAAWGSGLRRPLVDGEYDAIENAYSWWPYTPVSQPVVAELVTAV